MKVLTIIFLMALSAQVSAKNRVELMLESKTGTTPYEILKEFHESEGRHVELREMNFYDSTKREYNEVFKSCVSTTVHSTTPSSTDLIIYLKTKIIPGVPSQGPLFPGTPEKRIPQYTLLNRKTDLNYEISDYIFDITTISINPDSTTVHLSLGTNNITTAIRLHDDMLSFYMENSYTDETNSYVRKEYGYCWND